MQADTAERGCLYCGAPLGARRRVGCCDAHTRKVSYQRRRPREWFVRWSARVAAAATAERLRIDRWRNVAMGRDADRQLDLIFNERRKPQ